LSPLGDKELEAMPLREYKKKRDFSETPEPGPATKTTPGRAFVIQKHRSSHLHYDLRLEDEGVLKSWAVTKEPPREAGVKRLAVRVEDHPYEYKDFSGEIPQGQYGAGTVEIWDRGTYRPLLEDEPDNSVTEAIERGALKFELHGERLQGRYVLYHFDKKGKNWFFFRMKG
jgi:bifunctional non-homologous end joining protein LigD